MEYIIGISTGVIICMDWLIKAGLSFSQKFVYEQKQMTKKTVLIKMLFTITPLSGLIYFIIEKIKYFLSLPLK